MMKNNRLPAVVVKDLKKTFQRQQVLKGVSFTVESGSIFALLGSNGAGKTTIVNILSTLKTMDSGCVMINQYDVVKQPNEVRRHITLTGQYTTVDELLSGRENLYLIGELRNLPHKKTEAAALLELFSLQDAADRLVATYSGGMRRRLDIAMSMMGQASIVFLDEPTTGLDPQNRREMWRIIREMAAQGTTVFLTTQYLYEAELLADQIAILHDGVILAKGTPATLKQVLPQGIINLQVRNEADEKKVMELLKNYPLRKCSYEHGIEVQTDGTLQQLEEVLHQLNKESIILEAFTPKQPTIEDAFFALIGETQEESV